MGQVFFKDLRKKKARPCPVQINSGSSRDGDIFLPNEDWRDLSTQEKEVLACSSPMEKSVALFDVDPCLLETFSREVEPVLFGEDKLDRAKALKDFSIEVVQKLAKYTALQTQKIYNYEVCMNAPFQKSTAYDHTAGSFVGLHVDTHQKLDDLTKAFQLCSINLGASERFFYFINLDIKGIASKLGIASFKTETYEQVSFLKNHFLSSFPDYPIYRLCIQPGQAYLAVSQNMIHDGATNVHGNRDIVFFLGGYFSYDYALSC